MDVVSIILGVLGAIGGVLWVSERIDQLLRSRAFHQVFPRTADILIVAPTLPGVVATPNHAITLEDAFALAIVQRVFARRRIRFRVKPHYDVTAGDRAGWMFIVAGPSTNAVAAKLREDLPLPLRFSRIEPYRHVIVADDGTEYRYEPPIQEPDYAIVGAFRNPWADDPGVRVYLCAGLEGVGTWAAASALVERPRELARTLRTKGLHPRRGFQCLISARVDDRMKPVVKFLRAVAVNIAE